MRTPPRTWACQPLSTCCAAGTPAGRAAGSATVDGESNAHGRSMADREHRRACGQVDAGDRHLSRRSSRKEVGATEGDRERQRRARSPPRRPRGRHRRPRRRPGARRHRRGRRSMSRPRACRGRGCWRQAGLVTRGVPAIVGRHPPVEGEGRRRRPEPPHGVTVARHGAPKRADAAPGVGAGAGTSGADRHVGTVPATVDSPGWASPSSSR